MRARRRRESKKRKLPKLTGGRTVLGINEPTQKDNPKIVGKEKGDDGV